MSPSTGSFPQMSAMAGLGGGQSQELGTQCKSPIWVAGTQLLEPSRLPPRSVLAES